MPRFQNQDHLGSAKLLRRLLNSDLESAKRFEAQLDLTEGSKLPDLLPLLPSLTSLRLSNGLVPRLECLGCRFENVTVLWVSRCQLSSLEGADLLPNLEELYAAFNNVQDLVPLSGLAALELADLEGNKLDSFHALLPLRRCSALSALTLEGNPLAGDGKYAEKVAGMLPGLDTLDDEPALPEGMRCPSPPGPTRSPRMPVLSPRVAGPGEGEGNEEEGIIDLDMETDLGIVNASLQSPCLHHLLSEGCGGQEETHQGDSGNVFCGNPTRALRRGGASNDRQPSTARLCRGPSPPPSTFFDTAPPTNSGHRTPTRPFAVRAAGQGRNGAATARTAPTTISSEGLEDADFDKFLQDQMRKLKAHAAKAPPAQTRAPQPTRPAAPPNSGINLSPPSAPVEPRGDGASPRRRREKGQRRGSRSSSRSRRGDGKLAVATEPSSRAMPRGELRSKDEVAV